MDKFLGKPKSQKAAAMMEEEDPSEEGISKEESDGLEEARVAATNTDTLAQLLEQQKALMEEIAKWREEGF